MTFDRAYEEVVADACESFLRDSYSKDALVALAQLDENLSEKVIRWIKDFVNLIENAINALKGQTPNSKESQYVLNELKDDLSKLHDLWDYALLDARENAQWVESSKTAQKNTTDEGDVKESARYAKQGGAFSTALTGAEWVKYNYSMTTGIDAGLRISDHSILVECEKGDYTYKLVIYDNRFDDSPINGVYGIGKNLYNEDISNFDAKLIGEFITNLEEQRYDNKQTLERILRYYSRNVGYVLGRYNSKSGRFNKYGYKVSENAKISRQKTNGTGVSQGVGKTQISSDIRFSERNTDLYSRISEMQNEVFTLTALFPWK